MNNAIFNVLGYIPGVRQVSGCVRMAVGLGLVGITLTFGHPEESPGIIAGHWYKEAIATGIAQVIRGALEALVPYGWVTNAALDVIATPFNLSKELEASTLYDGCMARGDHIRPHKDTDYPFPFTLLHLV